MNPSVVYDFEGNMPDIIAAAFPTEMNVGTLNLAPNIQKPRPRTDLMFRGVSAAPGPRIMGVSVGNPPWNRVIGAYEGDLEMDLITEPSADGKSQHSAYRSAVRMTLELDRLRNKVNISSSPYQIDFLLCSSSSDTVQTGNGWETSKMIYRVQFSIKVDAFNQMASTN